MKKAIIVGVLLVLCRDAMGAQYNTNTELELQPVYLQSQRSVVYDPLEQLVENETPLSDADKGMVLEGELKNGRLLDQNDCNFMPPLLVIAISTAAFVCKITSYVITYKDIKQSGRNITINAYPCDSQLIKSLPSGNTPCGLNGVGDMMAYTLLGFITLGAVYSCCKYIFCPQQSKYAID